VVKTVLIVYAAGTVLGAAGVAVVYLDPVPSLWLVGAVAVAGVAALAWLARVPMESG